MSAWGGFVSLAVLIALDEDPESSLGAHVKSKFSDVSAQMYFFMPAGVGHIAFRRTVTSVREYVRVSRS